MSIDKIQIGTVNDDFIHDRITAKVFSGDRMLLLKIYEDGTITSFFEDRLEGTIEKKIADEFRKELYASENIEFYFMGSRCVEKASFEKFITAYKEKFK